MRGEGGGRPAKMIRAFRCTLSLKDWSEVSGIPAFTIRNRILAGWTPENALIYLAKERPGFRGGPRPRGEAA